MRNLFAARAASLLFLFALLGTSPARAFDCTPIETITNNGVTFFGQVGVNSVSGEPLCGFDYTGWNLHVYEFTITQPSLQVLFSAVNDGGADNHLLLFEQCAPNACVYSAAGTGTGQVVIQELVCLAPGTYTLVMASQAPANTVYNVATQTFDVCSPVPIEESTWGTLKSDY